MAFVGCIFVGIGVCDMSESGYVQGSYGLMLDSARFCGGCLKLRRDIEK